METQKKYKITKKEIESVGKTITIEALANKHGCHPQLIKYYRRRLKEGKFYQKRTLLFKLKQRLIRWLLSKLEY